MHLFEFKFPHIGAWHGVYRMSGESEWKKARVAWRLDRRGKGTEQNIDLWCKTPSEAEALIADNKPFVVGLAEAKDWEATSKSVKDILRLCEVIPTGHKLDGGIETSVLQWVA